jgi:ParB family transcriptional regulator, chromosome partitioning protein
MFKKTIAKLRGERMTTTAAAEKTAGEKERMEKRRALGRGLESLLPGPRAVPVTPRLAPTGAAPGQSGVAAGKQQIPQSVRNNDGGGDRIEGVIQAVAEDAVESAVAQEIAAVEEHAELRPTGQPGAGVPAFSSGPGHSGVRTYSSSVPADSSSFPADSAAGASWDEGITIMAQAETRVPGNLVIQLALTDIDKNPFQTRYVGRDDALDELAESIKANGVVQPILVRPAEGDGRYILILGERRLHASKLAGRETIPAIVRRVSEQQAAEMTIIENLQRQDLSPLEQAEAFRVLSQEFKLTQAQIGERVGLSRESVANYMRLLKLPRQVMQLLAEKKIKFAEAKELLKLEGDDQIEQAALYAVKKGMTLEQIERMVLSMNGLLDPFPGMPGQVVKKTGTARWVDPNVRAAQMDLERLLGVRVRIRDRKGKGKIVIEYATVDDYDRVVEMLRGKK